MTEMRKQMDAMHKDTAAGTGTKKPAPRDGK